MILIYCTVYNLTVTKGFFGGQDHIFFKLVLHCIRNHLRSWASPAARGGDHGVDLGHRR